MKSLFEKGTTAAVVDASKKPRRQPRVLMHVWDAGDAGPVDNDHETWVRFKCRRCDHETDWVKMPTVTAAKRGIPCPVCECGKQIAAIGQEFIAGMSAPVSEV